MIEVPQRGEMSVKPVPSKMAGGCGVEKFEAWE